MGSEVTARPARVIHIVESLDRGAVENWLMRMLRHAQHRGVNLDWSFYCALPRHGELDEEARALGAEVIHSPVPIANKLAFLHALRRTLRAGSYDTIHCHHDLISGSYLLAATGVPLRRRIVHAHNADEELPTPSRLKRLLYREPMRRVCLTMADRIVGISNHTLDTFLAGAARRSGRDLVHYYGVDPEPFRSATPSRGELRQALLLAPDTRILLFAGRLVPEKNPLLVLDVLSEMRRRDRSVAAVFVGTGSLEAQLRSRAVEIGVAADVRLLGWRDDVPALMSCCDWFILPRPERPMEGFGLAVVEAQLAGLRLLLSRGIPDDPLLPTASFRRLSLGDSPAVWADAAFILLQEPPPERSSALAALARSPMDMDFALSELVALDG